MACDLEVDVNGEEIFIVDKKIISSYSGRLRKLFGKSTNAARNFKVIFNEFPGGAESFELALRFCYNNGRIDATPSNIVLLHCCAQFMEMNNSVSGVTNLIELTEKSLQEINHWTWSELLITIKQCQDLLPLVNSSGILEKCVDCIVARVMAMSSELSPCPSTSSPDSSGFRFSFETRSTESLKNSLSKSTLWFEDLSVLSDDMIEKLIKSMVSRKFNHGIISRFLFYYQKSKSCSADLDEKRNVIVTVIDMLYILDSNSVSCKSLFWILRVALSLKVSKCSRNKLESMIGSQMDRATLDDLLIPSPCGMNYLYDVNLVLRFVKAFLRGGLNRGSPSELKKVASLMDLYIAEVAPDPRLKPSKFLALAMILPDSARDSYDELYHAMDMYLKVHAGLSEEETTKICCALNYEKLSAEACIHLTQNKKFPSKTAVQALMYRQLNLKTLVMGTGSARRFSDSLGGLGENGGKGKGTEADEQIVVYAENLDFPNNNEKLRAHLKGMQWRVMELKKVCRKVQTQTAKMMKSKVPSHSHSNARSLPKLCS